MIIENSKMEGSGNEAGAGAGGAFGAGKAGAPFDPLAFIRKPQVILRVVSWLFSVIVFGCISAGGTYEGVCLYNKDTNACNYGMGIGVLAFIGCIAFLVVDALFDNMSSVQHRKYAVIGDMGFSGLWTFLWFVGFCYLTNKWASTDKVWVDTQTEMGRNNVQAAIAFSFFSICSWAGLTVLAVMRYRQGSAAAFAPSYEPDPNAQQSAPYSSYPGPDSSDPYQQPPFSQPAPQQGGPEYQPPTY